MTETDINVALYRSIAAANEPRIRERWHASDIARCPRAQFLCRKGVAPITPPTAAKMLRWEVGHHVETTIRPHLASIYPELVTNQRYESDTWDLTGEFDGYDPESETLISVKSIHPFAAKHMEKENNPYLAHEYQEHAYVLLLREHKLPVKQIHYQYITLDGLLITYLRGVNEAIFQDVNNRLLTLNDAWKEGKAPACVCHESHPLWKSSMQYCDYREAGQCCKEKP